MAQHKIEDIRNVSIVGHRAVGKTSLVESMMFKAGANDRLGKVADKTSLSDFDPEEHERQFSIESSILHLNWKNKMVNLIDTPGYPDFIGQCIGALRASETAVIVLSAPSGIELNTRRTHQEATNEGLAKILVINHMDAENIAFDTLISNIQETFGNNCVPLNLPIGTGENFEGVVSTLAVPETVPAGTLMDPASVHQQLVDSIIESDEEMMERYLEGEEPSLEEVTAVLGNAVSDGTLIPILFTSAEKQIGIDELLDVISEASPSPIGLPRTVTPGDSEDGSETVTLSPTEDSSLIAQVFKTRIDPFVAKMSFLRIFSGTVTENSSVTIARTGKPVRVGQLVHVQGGDNQSTIAQAGPGDIIAVVKVEELMIGDILTGGDASPCSFPLNFPKPMVGLAAQPKNRGDEQKISGTLTKITEEDPTFCVTRDGQTKELVITGMSELHLTVIQSRMRKRDKLEIETRIPKTPYRETIAGEGEASYRHKKQSGGRGQFAEVHLRLRSIPRELDDVDSFFTKDVFTSMRAHSHDSDWNFGFVDSIVGGSIPNNFIPAVEKGVRERMEQGVLAGNQVQDVCVEVFFGKYHPVDSSEQAFKTAARMAFRDAFQNARPVILEPICDAEIVVPAEYLGDITSDLNTRRGRVNGMEPMSGDMQLIRAQVPLSETSTYARALSSITAGQGSYSLEFSHYDAVPPNIQQQIIDQAKKDSDEEE